MLQKFKELGDASHPDNLANGTLELNTVYQSGNIAMQVQYHEFAASVENPETSVAAGGKTAYAPCPKGAPEWNLNRGPACQRHQLRHRRHRHQRQRLGRPAARGLPVRHLVHVSEQIQYDVLAGLGGTPTRKSVLERPDVQAAKTAPDDACRTR
jgi:multiple sugar transport system substrate-binding protein